MNYVKSKFFYNIYVIENSYCSMFGVERVLLIGKRVAYMSIINYYYVFLAHIIIMYFYHFILYCILIVNYIK